MSLHVDPVLYYRQHFLEHLRLGIITQYAAVHTYKEQASTVLTIVHHVIHYPSLSFSKFSVHRIVPALLI